MKAIITDTVMMIRPAHFGYNEETAANNAFQRQEMERSKEEVEDQARTEFDAFVRRLQSSDIRVQVIADTPEPLKPDAVFPNNWISFHADGKIITYPMFSEIRRQERRLDVVRSMQIAFGFNEVIDYSHWEQEEKYLEGTGSMLFERRERFAFACISPRTHPDLFQLYCQDQGYQPVLFEAEDGTGQLIYHTNVMMAMGESYAVICLDAIPGARDRDKVTSTLRKLGKSIIEISLEQVNAFAGNMLLVHNKHGIRYLILSEQAFLSLNSSQINSLEKEATILQAPIYTIEKLGGGSVRCMLAEVFLPKK
ncbi:MAG TPA: arginine deiminase-related protein [Saprospiraceae bacterium]|nr:arginine deiminase-related protein [Saprospiraceae bacterium]